MSENKQVKIKIGLFFIITIGLSIGAIVPIIVDIAVYGLLKYSIIAFLAQLFTWIVLAPWFLLREKRFFFSWLAAFITLPILLLVIENISDTNNWFIKLGLPSSIIALLYLGVIGLLWIKSNLKILYSLSITVLLTAGIGLVEYILAKPFLGNDPHSSIRVLVLFIILCVAVFIGLIGLLVHRLSIFKAETK